MSKSYHMNDFKVKVIDDFIDVINCVDNFKIIPHKYNLG